MKLAYNNVLVRFGQDLLMAFKKTYVVPLPKKINAHNSADNCVATLIKIAKNRNITKIQITNPIIETISEHHVVAIPAGRPLKIRKTCNVKEFLLIEGPNLIEVPYNCGIVNDDSRIWNKQKILKGYPLTLPQIRMTKYNQEYSETKPIRLHCIEKLHHL
ncbi:hypothetical protein JTB14_010068 [Gonioctena quinquepunctata]|nr:hypothetical protein JTB14_010068 [Gonioctena quinquepunctata]